MLFQGNDHMGLIEGGLVSYLRLARKAVLGMKATVPPAMDPVLVNEGIHKSCAWNEG